MLEDVNYTNNNYYYYYNRPQQNQGLNQQRPNYSVKRGDPGRPIISISIGMVDFPEALCDFGSSVNIMPRVLYKKILYTSFTRNNHVFAACRSDTKFPKGNIKNLYVRVGTLYAPADFVVMRGHPSS